MPSPSLLGRRPRPEPAVGTVVLKALGLAAVSGVRSMAAPALISGAVRRGSAPNLRGTPFAKLGSGRTPAVLQALMIGEMVGDKTPFIPARTSAPALLGRALSGAFAGSVMFVSGGRSGIPGALAGAVSALAATYAVDYLRSVATQSLGVPDPIFGLLEDALVLFGGSRLLEKV